MDVQEETVRENENRGFNMGNKISAKSKDEKLILHPSVYEGIRSLQGAEIGVYEHEVCTNLPVRDGVILSPYYTMKINGKAIPVYAARSANGIHSFVYVDIEGGEEGCLQLKTEISATENSTALRREDAFAVVLPRSRGVIAEVRKGKATAKIDTYGSYSFAFNGNYIEPLTLIIKRFEPFSVPEGYTIKRIEPNNYVAAETNFTQENTVYYFEKGRYETDTIRLPANSVFYLERGVYITVTPSPDNSVENAVFACGDKNIRFEGRGIIDFSACCGGETFQGYTNNKSGIAFSEVMGASVRGLSIINAQSWSLCFYNCEDVYVSDVFIMGYRVFSDGVMLSDCRDGIVENCFVRTGDDAFETKSTTKSGYTNNILFRNNAAWTDKAVAYGCIYESNHDTENVRFENNSVGFALGTWSKHLGCNVIQMGDNPEATMHDIQFVGTEIYTSYNQAICNIYIGGSGGRGEGWGKVKNILFRDIEAENNRGLVLYIQTFENEYSEVKSICFENIVSNGKKFLQKSVEDKTLYDINTQVFNAENDLHVMGEFPQ